MSNFFLVSRKIDSKAELFERIKQSHAKTVLLGQEAQQSTDFIEILVNDAHTDEELLRIGVVCEGHGLKPQYTINELDELVIGFNKEICLIFLDSLDKVLKRELDSLFYEFKFIKSHNVLLVVCETELYCLNKKLEILWTVSLDLIVDHEITEEYIKVVMDEETRVYSILDGRLR